MSKQLFTVGHSNLSITDFISLITQYNIEAIADIRSYPYSRYLPHFNRNLLKFELLKAGIKYVFIGDELGARPKDLSCYINGTAVYNRIAISNSFKSGIERIIMGIDKYNISLMCSEKEPINCHRTILIGRYLQKLNLKTNHIIDDKTIESQSELEDRLLNMHGFDVAHNRLKVPEVLQLDLFGLEQPRQRNNVSKAEFIERAYSIQEQKIAYKQ